MQISQALALSNSSELWTVEQGIHGARLRKMVQF